MLPDVEVGVEQVFDLLYRGIELDPLLGQSVRTSLLLIPGNGHACLFAECPTRSLAMPEEASQSTTESTLD